MATTSMKPPKPDKTEKAAAETDPFGPAGDRSGPPFIVNGVDPSSNANPDADSRLAWMEAQQAVMNGKPWRRPE